MGTRIDSVATAHERGRVFGRGALHLTDRAATRCLARAHHDPSELDLLINAGIYKDRNAAEPALASIIQEDIHANPGSPPHPGHHGTFSFDVLNGGCGVITAAQLVDAFVGHGSALHGMVVAGDVDPSPRTSSQFPFSPAGGAMLISHTDDNTGFQLFDLRTFPDDAGLFQVVLRWDPRAGLLHRGRNVIDVREAPAFAPRCIDHAIDVASSVIERARLRTKDIDLVIASQYPRTFATGVMRGLGLPIDRLPVVRPELSAAHTAGPLAALEAAFESGRFAASRHTLFVTAGAGITIGVALYSQVVA